MHASQGTPAGRPPASGVGLASGVASGAPSSAASSINKADYEKLAAFRYRIRRFLRYSEETARAVGITPQQHQLLVALKGFPGREWATVGELAERLQLRHHSVVGILDRCERGGLVRRSRHPRDRRAVRVFLTPQGEAVLAALTAEHQQELRRLGLTWEGEGEGSG